MTNAVLVGFCQCGCGERTTIAKSSCAKRGQKRGVPMPFRQGHHMRVRFRDDRPARKNNDRYLAIRVGTRAGGVGEFAPVVYAHRLIVERAIGRPLSRRNHVHHVNGDRLDNRPCNLVACENAAYHKLLHARARAREVTGNPDARQCWICRQWDVPGEGFRVPTKGSGAYHMDCIRFFERTEKRVGSPLTLAWMRLA